MTKIALYAAALLALAAGPAHAGPLAAVVGWLGGLSFASGIAGALARIALGLAFNLLSTAIAKKMAAKRQTIDVKMDVEIGDDRPLSFTAGFFASAGKRKFIGSWGPNTRFITEVIEVSCLPQPGQPGLWVNDTHAEIDWNSTGTYSERIITGYTTYTTDNGNTRRRPIYGTKTVTMGHPVTNYAGGLRKIWVKWVAGPTEADPFLVAVFGEDPDYPWTAEMIGTGKSYLIVTTEYDADSITSYPQYLIEPPPLPMYDPRKDSTAGGSGSHRWGNRSTYEPSLNPAVIAYNIARGIYLGDEWIFGGRNLSAWRLPLAEWIAAMNACDDEVDLAEGGTEPAYRCGAEITVDMEPLGVLEEIGRAANMRFAEVGGRLKPIVGLPGASVFTITDADIITTEGQSLTPFLPVAQTYNALTATYPEPAEKWASKPAPEYVDAEATAADDGEYLPVGIAYGAAPFTHQVQRLVRAQLRDYRRMIIAQFQLPPEAFGLEPLVDMITWISARNGYAGKQFVVESIAKLAGMNVAVTLREVDPGDYDWSSDWEQPVVIVPPVNVIPVVLEPEGFAAVGVAVQSEDGRDRLPGIQCSCAGGLSGVASVRIQVRKIAAAEPMLDVERPYAEPHVWTVTGVAPETTYFVRLALVSDFGVPAEWSDEIEVVTPQILIDFPDLAPDVEGAMEAAIAAAALAAAAQAGAEAAETGAVAARLLAETAMAGASTARTAAEGAAAAALASQTAAAGSASAASGFASTAAAAADDAGDSATAAAASATAANTSAGQASTSASQAATSATNAAGSASSAATSASTAARVVAWSNPSDFAEDGRFWSSQLGGAPSARGTLTAAISFATDATVGRVAQIAAPLASNALIGGVGYVPAVVGRRYRLTVRARHVGPFAGGSQTALRLNMRRVTAAWASGTDFVATFFGTFTAPDSWQDFTLEGVYSGTDPYFQWFAWCALSQMGTAGPVVQFSRIRIEDITAQTAAADSASAAATSATAASASQTAAGSSASAAATSATNAATSAGQASTSATAAATSATNAAGSANMAATYAQTAATLLGRGQNAVVNQYLPASDWLTWSGSPTVAANELYPQGQTWTVPVGAGGNAGFYTASAWPAAWKGIRDADSYTVEVEFTLVSGTLVGAGVIVDWRNTAAATFRASQQLSAMVSGGVATVGVPTIARGVFKRPAGFTGTFQDNLVYMAGGFTGFGTVAAKTIKVHRVTIYATGADATAAITAAEVATAKSTEAGGYAAEALSYRNVAARLMSGGVSKNPIFNAWSGTYPDSVSVTLTGGTVAKATAGVRYINAIEIDATTAANGPLVSLVRTGHGLDCSVSPKAVLVRMEVEYISGDLAASGALLRGHWIDTASRVADRPLKDLISATTGIVQTVEVYMDRPATAVPASATNFRIDFYGHTNTWGGSQAPLKVRLHRLDFEEVLSGSATEMWQRAAVDFQGVQSAVVGFRAEAGSAGASVELVALDDPAGPALSGVTINGQYIRLNGDTVVDGDFRVTGDMISGGLLTREFLSTTTYSASDTHITASGILASFFPTAAQVPVDFLPNSTAVSADIIGEVFVAFSTTSTFRGRLNANLERRLDGLWSEVIPFPLTYYIPAGEPAGLIHTISFGPVSLAKIAAQDWEAVGIRLWLETYAGNHVTTATIRSINFRVWQMLGEQE